MALVSLAAQGLYYYQARHDPSFDHPLVDARTYELQAHDLAAGRAAPAIPYWQPPLYAWWLGLNYAVKHGSRASARGAQMLLGMATCLLTVVLARRVLPPRWAVAAGLATALYGPLIFYNLQLLPPVLACFLDLLVLWLLLRAWSSSSLAAWLACGLAAGIAALAVANLLAVMPLLVAVALAWRAAPSRQWRPALRGLAAFLLGMALGVAPAAVRNAVVSGEWVPVSANGGINLFIGNNADAARTMAIRPDADWSDLERLPVRHGVRTASGADRFFKKQVAGYMLAQPVDFLRGLAAKTRWFWNARELPRNTDLYAHAAYSSWLRLLVWRIGPFAFPWGVVAPLALLGLLVAARRRDAGLGLMAGFVLLYSASVILFFVCARYRVVLVPLLIVLAAAGLQWLWQQRRARLPLAGGLAVVLAAAVFANTPIHAPTDGVNFAAELHLLLGWQAAEEGDGVRAETELQQALAIQPDYPQAFNVLGYLRLQQGQPAAAAAAYARAVELAPGFAEAHNNLGRVRARQGRMTEAMAEFEAAIRLRPQLAKPHHNLGQALVQRGRGAEAVVPLRDAVRLDPFNVEAANDLAWLLATHPDPAVRNGADAVRLAETALQLGPVTPAMLDTLAAAYAEAGQFPEAAATAGRAAAGAGQSEWARQVMARARGYAAGQPYRDPALQR